MEEIEQELLRNSSQSVVTSRPNGESMPMLTVEELERKLHGQTGNDVQSSSSSSITQSSITPSGGYVPVTRIPGLLPIVPGSIPVCCFSLCYSRVYFKYFLKLISFIFVSVLLFRLAAVCSFKQTCNSLSA